MNAQLRKPCLQPARAGARRFLPSLALRPAKESHSPTSITLPFPTTLISTLHRALSQLHHCHTKSDPHGLRDVLKTTLSSEVSTVCVIFHLVASYTASQIHPPLISLPSALKVTVTSRHMNVLYCEWLLQSPMLDGQHTHLYSFSNPGGFPARQSPVILATSFAVLASF